MNEEQTRPLNYAEVLGFRELRAIIPPPRASHPIPIDWTSCPLAHAYGPHGEIPEGSTSRRRRALVA